MANTLSSTGGLQEARSNSTDLSRLRKLLHALNAEWLTWTNSIIGGAIQKLRSLNIDNSDVEDPE